MEATEILTKISELLEKFGIKEALKKPEVVETIYNVMSQHGMKVDKNMFNLVVMGFASTPTDKLGQLLGLLTGAAGAVGAAGQAAGQGGQANPLAAILGAVAQGSAAQSQPQQQAQGQGAAANPLAALGALGALAGAIGGAAQGGQQQQPQQQQSPTAADLLGGLAQALSKK